MFSEISRLQAFGFCLALARPFHIKKWTQKVEPRQYPIASSCMPIKQNDILSTFHVYLYIYIYIYIYFYLSELLSCSSHFFLNDCRGLRTASSQDLLWVAGLSSLTSLTRDSWLGSMSDSLTCIHLGYTPNALVLPKHYRNWKIWITALKGKFKICSERLDWNLMKDRELCHGSWAPRREIGSAQLDLLGKIFPKQGGFQSKERNMNKLCDPFKIDGVATASK